MALTNDALDMIVAEVVSALDGGLSPNGRALLESVQAERSAVGLLSSRDEFMRVVGCQALTAWLRDKQGDLVGASRLAFATAEFLLQRIADPDKLVLENVLTVACSVGIDAAQTGAVLQRAPEWAALLALRGCDQGAQDVRLKQAEALLDLGEYEAARTVLDRESGSLPPHLAPIRDRLYGKTGLLCRPDEIVVSGNPAEIVAKTLDWLKREIPDAAVTHTLAMTPLEALTPTMLGMRAPSSPSDLAALLALARSLPSHRSPRFAIDAVLGACPAFIGKHETPETHAAIRDVARMAMAAADSLRLWESGGTARWLEIVALRRLKCSRAALSALQSLLARIDECRARISDPQLRAGIAIWLPHLSWTAADTALEFNDTAALLHAMETAKARILSDIRPAATDHGPRQLKPDAFLAETWGYLAKNGQRRHLVAYLVDNAAGSGPGENGVLALLLSLGGKATAQRIPLTQTEIAAAAQSIQRRVRGGGTLRKAAGIDPRHPDNTPFDDIGTTLAPLVAWIEPLLRDGTIRQDDTLVVSPDGPIHNVPFAMLPLCGAPLIDRLAIVNIPSAFILLSRSPAPRPTSAVAFLKPTDAERKSGADYAGEAEALAKLLPTTVTSDGAKLAADLAMLRPGLWHLAAHGEESSNEPLLDKGIALAGDSTLWLTAETIRALPLDAMHVGVRACLCGVVRQITSREALGMVWAVLGAGAASLTAALWSVDIPSASDFYARFYAEWLGDHQNRAVAHARACRALRAQAGPRAHPYHYAPFVLTASTLEGDIA